MRHGPTPLHCGQVFDRRQGWRRVVANISTEEKFPLIRQEQGATLRHARTLVFSGQPDSRETVKMFAWRRVMCQAMLGKYIIPLLRPT